MAIQVNKKMSAKVETKVEAKTEPKVLPDLTQPVDVSVTQHDPSAKSVGTYLARDTQFVALAEQTMDAPESVKRGPVQLHQAFCRLFPAKGNAARMADFPVVGKRQEEVQAGEPFDIRSIWGKKADGSPKKTDRSWYQDMADDFFSGLEENERPSYHVAQVALAKQKPAAGIYSRLATNPTELSAIENRWKGRNNNFIAASKKAARIEQTLVAINEMPLVTAEYATITAIDPTTKAAIQVMTTTLKPLKIKDRFNTDLAYQLTVSQFIDLDVDAALAAGGTLDLLYASSKGKGADDKADGETEDKEGTIKTVKDWEIGFARQATFLDTDNSSALIMKELAKKPEDSRDLARTIYDVWHQLSYFMDNGVRARVEADIKASVAKPAKSA